MFVNNRYLIKTENGYQDFYGVQKSEQHKGLAIIFDNCYIVCTENHLIKKDGVFIKANTLKINDIINSHKILDIYPCYSTFYDIIGVKNNTYSCKGFEHHNCNVVVVDETAFIKSSIWKEFLDAIGPTQSSFAWKKNIYLSTANGMNHFKDMCELAQKKKRYIDLPEDTQIELNDGSLVFLKDYYEEHYGNKVK